MSLFNWKKCRELEARLSVVEARLSHPDREALITEYNRYEGSTYCSAPQDRSVIVVGRLAEIDYTIADFRKHHLEPAKIAWAEREQRKRQAEAEMLSAAEKAKWGSDIKKTYQRWYGLKDQTGRVDSTRFYIDSETDSRLWYSSVSTPASYPNEDNTAPGTYSYKISYDTGVLAESPKTKRSVSKRKSRKQTVRRTRK